MAYTEHGMREFWKSCGAFAAARATRGTRRRPDTAAAALAAG